MSPYGLTRPQWEKYKLVRISTCYQHIPLPSVSEREEVQESQSPKKHCVLHLVQRKHVDDNDDDDDYDDDGDDYYYYHFDDDDDDDDNDDDDDDDDDDDGDGDYDDDHDDDFMVKWLIFYSIASTYFHYGSDSGISTHLPLVPHKCVSPSVGYMRQCSIDSDIGLSSIRRQAIMQTNA